MKRLPLFLLCFIGCSTSGYNNNGRTPAEVATIYFKQLDRVSLKNKTVDGVTQSSFTNSVAVPAGNNRATVDYQLALNECPMFSIGCFDEVIKGHCSFTLKTRPGRSYRITVQSRNKEIVTSVSDIKNGDTVGEGSCAANDKDFTNSVLQRRSTIGGF